MNLFTKHETLVAVVAGRFSLAHNAHIALFRQALASLQAARDEGRAKTIRLVVVLGSAYHARTTKNPFTWVERKNMILAALTPEERELVSFVAVRDYHDDDRWARIVHSKVMALFDGTAHVQVFGHFKDASSAYLNSCFKQWQVVAVPKLGDQDATTFRNMLFAGGKNHDVTLSAMEGHVPDGVREYLKVWMQQPCYGWLQREFNRLAEEKEKYGRGPFVAGDGIYRTKTHVLLIRRKFHPGKGLLAIPGGFLESWRRETPRQCAEREGIEETKLGVLAEAVAAAYRFSEVFAHPDRSVRGNVISHAFFYDFDTEALPSVEAGDDAREAIWVPIAELRMLEDQFFDDHFLILDHFLGILRSDE